MSRKRRKFDGAFQARVALDAIRGLKTISELASIHKVHPTQIALWKKQLLEGASGVFEKTSGKKPPTDEPSSAELYEQIGRLKIELDWVKKKWPTTAGNFCRRFNENQIQQLMEALHEPRLKVWQQQPVSFFDLAIIEGDGTLVETCGEKKEGIGMNHKGQWGYHPLLVTLANTREVLYLENRAGNRPSHEHAAGDFDRVVQLCRDAGFRKVRLRGDTDFSQTTHLDRWHEEHVEFVFGMDAMKNLVSTAENLPDAAWEELQRKPKTMNKTGKTRARRPNYKEQFVVKKKYVNKILERSCK